MEDPTARVTMLLRNPFTADSRVEKEARSLARAGYRVTVVAEGRPWLPEREHRDGYAVVRVPRGPAKLPGLRMREYRSRLEAALDVTEPDVLHAHDSDALDAVARVAKMRGVPFVYDSHELWLGQENRGRTSIYHALFRAWYWWLQRRHVPRSAAVLTVNQPILERLESAYRVPVALVPNYPEYSGPPDHRELHALVDGPIPDGAPIVLYLGNIQVGRGLEELVTAMVEVPDGYLVCLGVTAEPAELAARASDLGVLDRIRFAAPVPVDEVVAYAASANVGVALATPISLNNRLSLPNKLFQYMAAGIPVVASDFPHIRTIVEDCGAGICVDPTQPGEIALAIRRILADPVAAAAMGSRGVAAVRDKFNWAQSERALLAVYARITGSA
jgi:glycosyltransferase involved in cell wall biosynthesis